MNPSSRRHSPPPIDTPPQDPERVPQEEPRRHLEPDEPINPMIEASASRCSTCPFLLHSKIASVAVTSQGLNFPIGGTFLLGPDDDANI
jgi:hypothetical protein